MIGKIPICSLIVETPPYDVNISLPQRLVENIFFGKRLLTMENHVKSKLEATLEFTKANIYLNFKFFVTEIFKHTPTAKVDTMV